MKFTEKGVEIYLSNKTFTSPSHVCIEELCYFKNTVQCVRGRNSDSKEHDSKEHDSCHWMNKSFM